MRRLVRLTTAGINQWRSVPRSLWSIGIATLISRSGGFLALFGAIYLAAIDLSPQEIVVTLGASGLLGVAGVTVSGILVDRFSPRGMLVATSGLNAGVLSVLALAPSRAVSMFAVVTATVLAQVFLPIASTIVASLGNADNRIPYFAAFRIFVNLGSLVSPLVAAALGGKHWTFLFLFSAAVSAASAVIVLLSPIGTPTRADLQASMAPEGRAPNSAAVLIRVLILFGMFAVIAAVYGQSRSTVALQISKDQTLGFYSSLLAMNALMGLCIELPLSAAIRKVAWRYSLGFGAALMTTGLVMTGLGSPAAPVAFLGFALFTLGEMVFAPVVSAAVASVAPVGRIARYQGYLSSAQSIGFSLGPAVGVAYFLQMGQMFWYVLAVIGCTAAVAVVILARWIQVNEADVKSARSGRGKRDAAETAPAESPGRGDPDQRGDVAMRVMVVDPVSTGSLYAPLFAERGAEVFEVLTARSQEYQINDTSPATLTRLSFDQDFDANVSRLAAFCRDNGIEVLVAGSEPGVPLVEGLRAMLGSSWTNDASKARSRYDKAAMFRALDESETDSLDFGAFESTEEAREFFSSFDFDTRSLVVKPAESAGSVDVVHVTDREQADSVVAGLLGKRGLFGDRVLRIVAQEYFSGTEFVVDTFSVRGEHAVTNICRYEKVRSESGHFIYKSLDWVDETHPDAARLSSYAREVLNALGVRNGASHLEIMADETRTVLIDFGARAHGASHPLKTFQLTGDSQIHREVDFLTTGNARLGSFELRRKGKILFFSRERPSLMIDANPTKAFQGIDGIEALSIDVARGAAVPATTNLMEALALGMCYIVGDDERAVLDSQVKAREAFRSLFVETP